VKNSEIVVKQVKTYSMIDEIPTFS